MGKIMKYYKPFIGAIILAIFLLFAQAICDLKLPNYMADIVNIGIQSNGIEEVAPKAISEDGLLLAKTFMTEENRKLVDSSYIIVKKKDSNYTKTYPLNEEKDIYILNTDTNIETLDNAFAISGKAFVLISKELNNNNIEIQESSKNLNISQLYKILPILNTLPQEKIDEKIAEASLQIDDTTIQIGKVFTKAFYEELGIDISNVQIKYIIIVGLKMLAITIIGMVAAIAVTFLASKVGAGLSRNLRREVFEKVENFSATEFNRFSEASLITRTTNDVTQIQNITVMGIRMLAYAPIMGIGSLIMLLNRTTQMTWTLAVGCVAILVLIGFLFKLALPKIKKIQLLTDKLNLVSKENLSGVMVTRAFGTQKYEEKRFNDINTEVTKVNSFVSRLMAFMMPAMMLIMNLLTILIIWVGAHQIAEATIQVGDLMAIMEYSILVIMSFLMISMIFVMLPRASVSAERIAEVLQTKSSINNPDKPKEFDKDKLGYVEFKNVSFKYEGEEELALENINFVARPGEITAFIGSTGSGKSTLINLIPRFFDTTKGQVLVNGINVKELPLKELHSQIGYVPQKGNLLSGTIEANLKYGNRNASDEFIIECAKIAQATEFIEEKEEKYKSQISQGAKNISGGQKQRISIARALATKAPILIFDDSFSALDYRTDSNLRNALKENSRNSTVLIVAQRVSTIMQAEQIIVLDKGKIVGKGKHEELLQNCETYKEIVYSQLSKEEVEGKKDA